MQPILVHRATMIFTKLMRRARRYPRASLLCVYAIAWLPLYLPSMLGLLVYAPGDTLGFNYPPLKALDPFSVSSLTADPFSGRGGFPWLATYGTLDPIAHVLRLFFSEYVTLAWLCYLYVSGGAWLFCLFLRRKNVSDGASFLGGLVYAGSFFWVADGDYPLASSLPLFAGMLLASCFLTARPFRAFLALSVIIAYGWLAGHFNYVPLMIAAMAVLTGVSSIRSGERRWISRLQPFVLFCAATALGSFIGLIKLIPALAFVQLSERAGGLTVEAASRYALTLSGAYTAFFPYMTVPFLKGEIGMLFFGAAGLTLLLVGILQHDRRVRLAIIGLAMCLLIAMPYSPLYALLHKLPFFSVLRSPRRWLFIGNACVAFIAACAADDVAAGRLRFVRGIGRTMLTIGIAAAAMSAAVTFVDIVFGDAIIGAAQRYFDEHLYAKTSGLPLDHYHRHIARLWHDAARNVSPFSLRFLLPLAGLLLTGWVVRTRLMHSGRKLPLLVFLTIISLLPSFFFLHPKASFHHLADARGTWSSARIGDAYVLPLLSGIADQTVRTGVYGDLPAERVRYQIGLLVPNTHALAEVRSIDFYQPIQPRRMGRLLAALGSSSAAAPAEERLTIAKLPLEEKIAVFMERFPLLQRLGVEYVSSVWELPAPLSHAQSLSFVPRLPDIRLYAVPDTRPAASIPASIAVRLPDEDGAIAYVRDAIARDPVLVECAGCEEGDRSQGSGTVTVEDEKDASMVLAVDVREDAFIHVLRPRLPGWRAFVDGQPVKTAIGDGLFFAIPVPKGTHEVRLAITYPSLLIDSAKQLLCGCDPWLL